MKKTPLMKLFFFVFFGLVSCGEKEPLRTGLEGQPLPEFSFLLNNQTSFSTTKSNLTKSPIVLLYFSPSCPHCKSQIESIIENIASLGKIQFLFITSDSLSEFHRKYDHFNFSKYSNILIGQDTGYNVSNYFGTSGVPYMAIYNNKWRLKNSFLGEIGVDQMKKIALEN